jgi:hypothetical protein
LISFETDPCGFIFNVFQAVGRFTVEREQFSGLRIQDNDSAVLAFELVYSRQLKRSIDGQATS